ncbi:uncharacterized protein LOC136038121 [Artemia franciscana]|uniref:Uncharacterized protein n=1 Tax=Artemia franciscana TaxID=6661 RepID=A0AA88I2I9_ARTSF|nr:hypothetical protein QYM36_006032 [Artemia franciscana]
MSEHFRMRNNFEIFILVTYTLLLLTPEVHLIYIGKPPRSALQRPPLRTSPTVRPKDKLFDENDVSEENTRRSLLSYWGEPGDPVTPKLFLNVFRLKDPKDRKEKKGKLGVYIPDIEEVEYADWLEKFWFRRLENYYAVGLIPSKIILHSRLFAWFRRRKDKDSEESDEEQ